jgi:hypothetical protein
MIPPGVIFGLGAPPLAWSGRPFGKSKGAIDAAWHDVIGDPTYADAILDRLVHNAHRIELAGESLRRARGKQAKTAWPRAIARRRNLQANTRGAPGGIISL